MRGIRHHIEMNFGPGCRFFWLIGMLVVSLIIFAADDQKPDAKAPKPKGTAEVQEVQLHGRIVCLPEAMHELYGTDLPSKHEHLYGFKTTDGTFYTLLRTKWSEGLFVDKRLQGKELILRGKVLPKTQIFDMTAMRSVRNGVVFDLYYYCDICAIKTLAPGPCMCCQGPVELTEKRVDSPNDTSAE
jgi:hypothetical protein